MFYLDSVFESSLQPRVYPDIGQPTPFTHPHLFDSDEEGKKYII